MIQTNGVVAPDKGKLRKLIRKKVTEIIKNGGTDVGTSVFPNATIPPWHSELPVILVYSLSEGASKYAEAPKELERDLDLAIEIIATGPEENELTETPKTGEKSLEDILDDIAEQVENLLDADDSLQGTADEATLQNTELELDAAGGSIIGSCRLTYGVTYFTMSPRDTSNQNVDNDFLTDKVDYNIGEDENTVEAEDEITHPT